MFEEIEARVVAHKIGFSHPDYHKIHMACATARFMQDSMVDGEGKRHMLPGVYRGYSLAGVSEAEERLKAELSKLGFPMDIKVWSVGEVRETSIEPNLYSDYLGALLGPCARREPLANLIPGFLGIASDPTKRS
jgi:hypothetical protein